MNNFINSLFKSRQLTEFRGYYIMENKKITGAHAFMQSLVQEGVDTIFGYPGGAIMPVFDALYDYDKHINHISYPPRTRCNTCCAGLCACSG